MANYLSFLRAICLKKRCPNYCQNDAQSNF